MARVLLRPALHGHARTRPAPRLDRYRRYRDIVAAHPEPAYALPVGSPIDRALAERLAARGQPARVEEVAGYRIYRLGSCGLGGHQRVPVS
ncbi:hypothetical protein [Phytohabitans kaempferiae]|uniref:Uncharacterized protein n=1 Tax=Phytohabitans kaempferiae TaxID=1620943 RepID=A0ABV6LZ70_9ACTN